MGIFGFVWLPFFSDSGEGQGLFPVFAGGPILADEAPVAPGVRGGGGLDGGWYGDRLVMLARIAPSS